jgi:hypothetical protein
MIFECTNEYFLSVFLEGVTYFSTYSVSLIEIPWCYIWRSRVHNLWEVMWSPQKLLIIISVEFALCAVRSLYTLPYDDLLWWERSVSDFLGECNKIWWMFSTLPLLNTKCFPECLLFFVLPDTSPAECLSICLAQGNWEMLHETHGCKLG